MLRREGRLFARYIAGEEPASCILERYAEACRRLLGDAAEQPEDRLVRFVRRYPLFLGPLDAAAGLLARGGDLRARLLIMTAILEARPEGAERFLPPACTPRHRVVLAFLSIGIVTVAKLAIGLPLYALLRRGR